MNISKTLARLTFETEFRVFYMLQKWALRRLQKTTFFQLCEILKDLPSPDPESCVGNMIRITQQ